MLSTYSRVRVILVFLLWCVCVASSFKYTVRKPFRPDLKPVAQILSQAFDEKPNMLVRWYSVLNYEENLKDRFVRLVEMDSQQHTMFVAKTEVPSTSGEECVVVSKDAAGPLMPKTGPGTVCGFIEVGLLALPVNRVPLDCIYSIDKAALPSLLPCHSFLRPLPPC